MTRLDNLVLVLAPVMVRARLDTGRPFEDQEELRMFASGIVGLAWMIEQAIADEELRQMTPPGESRGSG